MSVPENLKTSADGPETEPTFDKVAAVVEIASTSTRFISFGNWGKFASVIGITLAVGFAVGMRRGRKKLEKAPKTGSSES